MILWLPKPPTRLPSREELRMYAMQGISLWDLSKRLGVRYHILAAHTYNTYPEYKRVSSVMRRRRLEIARQNAVLRGLRQGVVDPNRLHSSLKRRILANAPPTYAALAFGERFAQAHPTLWTEVKRVDLLARALTGEAVAEELALALGLGRTSPEVEVAKAVFGLPYREKEVEEWRRREGESMPRTRSPTKGKGRIRRSGP